MKEMTKNTSTKRLPEKQNYFIYRLLGETHSAVHRGVHVITCATSRTTVSTHLGSRLALRTHPLFQLFQWHAFCIWSLNAIRLATAHTMQGDTCPTEWYMSNGHSMNSLGDILYPGFWLVKNRFTVRCICCAASCIQKSTFNQSELV